MLQGKAETIVEAGMRITKTRALAGFVALCAMCALSDVQAEIYKCVDADSNVTFQQTPCPTEPVTEPEERAADDKASPDEVPVESPPEPPIESRDPETIAACRQHYRDEIDRIYAKLSDEMAGEKLRELREEARALSQELRKC